MPTLHRLRLVLLQAERLQDGYQSEALHSQPTVVCPVRSPSIRDVSVASGKVRLERQKTTHLEKQGSMLSIQNMSPTRVSPDPNLTLTIPVQSKKRLEISAWTSPPQQHQEKQGSQPNQTALCFVLV